jgi:hypothetical protein
MLEPSYVCHFSPPEFSSLDTTGLQNKFAYTNNAYIDISVCPYATTFLHVHIFENGQLIWTKDGKPSTSTCVEHTKLSTYYGGTPCTEYSSKL